MKKQSELSIKLLLTFVILIIPFIGIKASVLTDANATDVMQTKATEFKAAITDQGSKPASLYVYNNPTLNHYIGNYDGITGANILAARIVLLGFTDVYLSVRPENNELEAELQNKEWIRAFNKYLHDNGIKVHALMFSEPSQFNPKNNSFIYRQAYVIQNYNATVLEEERFVGASADWEPHMLTVNSPYSEATYGEGEIGADLALEDRWADDRYGIGGANDRLMKRTGEMLELAKTYLDEISTEKGLPLLIFNQATNHIMQVNYDKGSLEYGDVSNFISQTRCNDINVMAYNWSKEEVWNRGKIVLDAAEAQSISKGVQICIKTRFFEGETVSTTLYTKGWNYLIETLKELNAQGGLYNSYKGISVYEFSGTEKMWEAPIEVEADRYNAEDKNVLRQFLSQKSADGLEMNYEKLGLTAVDVATWEEDENWISKMTANKVKWNNDQPAKITELAFTNLKLAGELDITTLDKINYLRISQNSLTDITFPSHYIESVTCSDNNLDTLDLSNVKIGSLQCRNSQVKHLILPENKTLTSYNFDVKNNYLKFSLLPKIVEGKTYTFSPQYVIDGGEIEFSEVIDLNTEYNIHGNITSFTWTEELSGDPIIFNYDSEGKFYPDSELVDKTLLCAMTNDSYPGLTINYIIKIKDSITVGLEDDEQNNDLTIKMDYWGNTIFVSKDVERIEIISAIGSLVTTSYNTNAVDMNNFPSGVYLIRAIDGNKYYLKKVITK